MKLWLCFVAFSCFCVFFTRGEPPSSCVTPNNETASCVLLPKCPVLLNTFASDDPAAVEFALASACGEGSFMVCCGKSGNFEKNQTGPELGSPLPEAEGLSKESKRDFVIRKLLPNRTYCGLQHTDDYLYNSPVTSVDEFPWLVYISVESFKRKHYFTTQKSCVGVLINNRYFLTTTGCITDSVTIGQHRIYEDVSCIETPYGDDCTTPSLNEIVEETKISFNLKIALVRLQRPVEYSDFVRPICLPLDGSQTPKPGEIVVTSGWGSEEYTEDKKVKIKKRVKHTVMDKHECESGNSVPNPICGVTLQNSTSNVCPGDNGGPLMYRYTAEQKNWVVLGIVTGRTSCAEYQPVVATRMTPEVVEWIIDNIEP